MSLLTRAFFRQDFKYEGCSVCKSLTPSHRGWINLGDSKTRCDSSWHGVSPHDFKWLVEAPPGDNLGATEKEMREILIKSLETYTAEPKGPILNDEGLMTKPWPRRRILW
jgi:hypothetical protein